MRKICRATKSTQGNNLFISGNVLKGKYLQLFFQRNSNYYTPPLFCVARSIFTNKPQRNRFRRLLREAFKEHMTSVEQNRLCVALMIVSKDASFKSLCAEAAFLVNKALGVSSPSALKGKM